MQYLAVELELDLEDDTPDEELQELAQAQVSDWLNMEATDEGFVGGWSDWNQVGGRWANVPVLIYNDDNACSFTRSIRPD